MDLVGVFCFVLFVTVVVWLVLKCSKSISHIHYKPCIMPGFPCQIAKVPTGK